MRPNLFHGILAVIVAGAGLFLLKHAVEAKQEHLAALKSRYLEDQKAVRVLEAEWAYLNSPEYLQALAERYLGLDTTAATHVVSSTRMIPARTEPPAPVTFALSEGVADDRLAGIAFQAAGPGGADEP